jgi:hypothetical protein
VIAKLEDTDGDVRKAALGALGKLAPETLATHADAVIAKLEDTSGDVRRAALHALGKLAPDVLAPSDLAFHATAVIAKLEDESGVAVSLTAAEADLIVAQLRGSRWRRSGLSGQEGQTHTVDAELRWDHESMISHTARLITTNAWWVTSARFDAGRLKSIEWQNGSQSLTWNRLEDDM